MRRPRWRALTWVLIVWCGWILVRVLILAGATHQCAHGADAADRPWCTANLGAQRGASVLELLFVGFVGCLLIGLAWFAVRVIWAMARTRARRCPACDRVVRTRAAVCPGCGLDLAAAEAAKKPAPSW